MTRPIPLVAVEDVPFRSVYREVGYPGTSEGLFLAEPTAQALRKAQAAFLAENPECQFLVLDGFRTRDTQRHLYDLTLDELMGRGLSREAALEEIGWFVAHPDRVFPHGTGGAVDLTMIKNGTEVWMGTPFDDVSDRAGRNYYRENPPQLPEDERAHTHRELLRRCMEGAGFVGLESEWWHYEFGTRRWGNERGQEPLLTEVLALS